MVIGGVIYGIIYVINGIQASVASTKESYVTFWLRSRCRRRYITHRSYLIVTVSKRKDWMYPKPGFLLRLRSGLTMRNIWRPRVGACYLTTISPLTCLSLTSYSSTSLRGLVKAAGASSFGKAENPTILSQHDAPSMERVSSDSSSITSQEKKKKKGIFRSRKWFIVSPSTLSTTSLDISAECPLQNMSEQGNHL